MVELDSSQWTLVSLNGKELLEGSHISLYFRNGSAWGFSACNIYGGEYTTDDTGRLSIQGIGGTAMGCPSPGILTQEERYWHALQNAASYHVVGERLEVEDAAGQEILVFERKPEFPMNPSDLVGTRWRLVSMNSTHVMEGLSITLAFDSDSEASGRAGCFDYELYYQARGDDIRWGMSASRDGDLPLELENQALQYTDSLMWGANYRLSTERLEIFTARGEVLIFESL